MFKVEDLIIMEEFLEKMRERDIIYEYEITAPILSSKEYFDSKKQKVEKVDTHTQKIEIILYKETKKEN